MQQPNVVRWIKYDGDSDEGKFVPSSDPNEPERGAGVPIEASEMYARQSMPKIQKWLSVCADGHGIWTPMPKALSTLQYSSHRRGWFGTTTADACAPSVRISCSYVHSYVCAHFLEKCTACGEPLECDDDTWMTEGHGSVDAAPPSFMEAWLARWIVGEFSKLHYNSRIRLSVLLDMVKTRHYPACTTRTLRRVLDDLAQYDYGYGDERYPHSFTVT